MAVISTITIVATHSVYALTADPVADADAYLEAKIGSTWAGKVLLVKQQSLVSAARMLDSAVIWSGARTVATQAREWPRDGANNNCTGLAVATGTIPDDIAEAEFELAQILADDADVAASSGTGSNIKRVKAGSAEVEFVGATIGTSDETRLPTVVNDLAGCFVQGTVTLGSSFGTGTSEADPGYCKDDFDKSQGFP